MRMVDKTVDGRCKGMDRVEFEQDVEGARGPYGLEKTRGSRCLFVPQMD